MTSHRAVDVFELQALMARHLPHYRKRPPHYQAEMLSSLLELGLANATRLLDVGGGTGIVAEAMHYLMPDTQIVSIDLVDRFCKGLSVDTQKYDGGNIPFGDREFDAATFNNVMHHVPVGSRSSLLREVRRVVSGSVYIKDHLGGTAISDLMLTLLDAIGNIPFGGMIEAAYLSQQDWEGLAAASGYRIGATAQERGYRRHVMKALFPNRLEITLRFDPV
jgi:SAM-dependent methyltransferase